MSAISDLYDGLVTILDTVLPATTYRQLVNPEVPELCDSPALNRGYGLIMGPKSKLAKVGGAEGFNFEIVIVQSIVHRGTDRDIAIRHAAEKMLLEDQYLVIDYFRQNTAPIPKVWDIAYAQDGGLELVLQNQTQFKIIQTTFTGFYSENC